MTEISFFVDYPDYRVAEPFPWVGLQFDDSTLKEFSKDIWEKFNPERDNRLNYIKAFWQSQGLMMDGSRASFWELEQWCWKESEKWRSANPEKVLTLDESVTILPKGANTDSSWPNTDEILSLARDVTIYHAECVLNEAKLHGQWKAWSGMQSYIARGYPYVEIENCKQFPRIDALQTICGYVNRMTIWFSVSDLDRDYGGLTRSVAFLVDHFTKDSSR